MDQKPQRSSSASVESALKAAALELLESDGVLSGFTLAEVAERAGVNRSIAYRRFGDRRTLLREALGAGRSDDVEQAFWDRENLPFASRYLGAFDSQVAHPEITRHLILRLLDGDSSATALHYGGAPLGRLLRDRANGVLPADVDVRAVRAAAQSITYGYVLFRNWMAREQAMEAEELDELIRPIFQRIFEALQVSPANDPELPDGRDSSAAPS